VTLLASLVPIVVWHAMGEASTFANRLRTAHGKVFTVVAAVRAGTRSDLIRAVVLLAVTLSRRSRPRRRAASW